MSIIEIDLIDAMGLSMDGKGLKLMLADHLDWENEIEHSSLNCTSIVRLNNNWRCSFSYDKLETHLIIQL